MSELVRKGRPVRTVILCVCIGLRGCQEIGINVTSFLFVKMRHWVGIWSCALTDGSVLGDAWIEAQGILYDCGSGRLTLEMVLVPRPESLCLLSLLSPVSATMGTTAPGPIYLLDLCDQKLLDFVYNVDNKDFMWLKEIEEEAERMFIR